MPSTAARRADCTQFYSAGKEKTNHKAPPLSTMFNVGDTVWVRMDGGSIKGTIVEVLPGTPVRYRIRFSPIFSGLRETLATADQLTRVTP